MGLMQSLGGQTANWIMRRPTWLRSLVNLGTGHYKSRRVLGGLLMTRAADVHEVLERDADFLVEVPMGGKMLWGEFVLGSDTLANERKVMIDGLRLVQDRYLAHARSAAQQALAKASGELDLARDYIAAVALSLSEEILGVKLAEARTRTGLFSRAHGHDAAEVWLSTLGSVIAQGVPAPFTMQAKGERCARELRAYVGKYLDAHREQARQGEPQTILAYLVQHMDKDAQERNLSGLLVVNFGIIVRAMSLTVNQLLMTEGGIDRAITLAQSKDMDGIRGLWLEALRFAPALPFLARYAPRDTHIGSPVASGCTHVAAGSDVGISLMHAMMDPAVTQEPTKFAHDRDRSLYMHFGAGPHRCLGEFIAAPLMDELMLQLFSTYRVTRLSGSRGEIQFDRFGPAARHFFVGIKGVSQ